MAETIVFQLEVDRTQAQRQLEENAAQLVRNREELAGLRRALRAGTISEEEFARQSVRLTQANKELNAENRQAGRIIAANSNTVEGLRAELARLTATANQLDVGSDEFEQAQARIAELNEEVRAFEERRGDFRRSVGNYAQALGPLGAGFSQLGNIITTSLGPIGLIALLAEGIRGLFDFGNALRATREEVNLLTGAVGDDLDRATAGIQATVTTFGADFSEVLIAANAQAQAFGISIEEATDNIQRGFAAGGDATGELLASTTEYSRLLSEVGLEASETTAILTATVRDGVFSDKGIDAIKEAGLSLREFTQGTADAIDGIGISSAQLQQDIESGNTTVFEAIQQISDRLGELPPQSNEVGTAIADIFRGAGEDAGIEFLSTLGDIETNLDNVVDSAGEFADANLRIADANQELNLLFNQLFGETSDGFNAIKATALEFLVDGLQLIVQGTIDLINFFIELRNESTVVRVGFELISAQIDQLKANFILAFDLIVNQLRGIGNVIEAVFTGDFSSIPDIIAETFSEAGDTIVEFGQESAQRFADAVSEGLDETNVIEPLEGFSNAAGEAGAEAGSTFGGNLEEGVQRSLAQILADQKANLERQLLAAEENSREQANLRIRLAETERDIALDNETLTQAERALIIAQANADITQIEVDFNQAQIELARQRLEEQLQLIEEGEQRKLLLLQQRLLNAEISETEFNERMFEIRQEALEAEIAQFEEGSIQRIEKEVELAQLRNDQLDAERQRERESIETVARADQAASDARIASAQTLAQAIVENTREGSAANVAGQILGRGVALAEIAFNLQRQLTANAAAGAKISAAGAPATVPAGIAYTTSRNVLAIAQAVAAGARVVAFEEGGIAFSGGSIPYNGGMITGLSHAMGGVKFMMGSQVGEADGQKGEAYIVNTNNNPYLRAIASAVNVAGGGRRFDRGGVIFQDGGIAEEIISSPILNEQDNANLILDVVSSLPPSKVLVDDIDDSQSNKVDVEDLATL